MVAVPSPFRESVPVTVMNVWIVRVDVREWLVGMLM
jgi:hypothetical protein